MFALFRWATRRTARVLSRLPPVRRLLFRLPFSRFASWIAPLMGGWEIVPWRGVNLRVNVGDYEGYFKFLDPEGVDYEADWLIAACRGRSVFFDVGANQGFMSLAVGRACPDLRVVAFEPDAVAGEMLRANLALNPDLAARIEVVTYAVGAAPGAARFQAPNGMNSGVGRLSESGGALVNVTTIGAFAAERALQPDVIKVDVEGAEADVLDGLGETRRYLRALAIEVHSYDATEQARSVFAERMLAHLERLPMRFQFLLDERHWGDTVPPLPWPVRFHLFGERNDSGPEAAVSR